MRPERIWILCAMIALLLGAGVVLLLAVRRRGAARKRLKSIRDSGLNHAAEAETRPKISAERFRESRLGGSRQISRLVTAMSDALSAAGLGDDPLRVILAWIILVIVLPMIENLMGADLIWVLVTIVAAALGPPVYITARQKKRKEKFEKQLPHAIDIMCNALKAGYTFQYAMNNVASELDDPISEEFLMAFRETQYGASLSTALRSMAKRTESEDVELLDVAVSVQTNVGGNMIEILENISATLRAKHDLEEDIKVKTASGKITGIMLACLPILLLLALNILNPEYISIFFEEELGRWMLLFCAVWETIGFLIIRKILKVRF